MAPKRKSTKEVVAVVSALTESEALPADLRTLLGSTLPSVLNTNKADRHAFEAEVVDQALEALSLVGKSIETKHSEALAKQAAIISPAERAARDGAEKDTEAKQKQAHEVVEACDTAKKESDKGVQDAETGVKAAQKEESSAGKTLEKTTKKKATLEGALTNDFAALTLGSSTKKDKDSATKLLTTLAKDAGAGGTLLEAFGLACKTGAGSRSEFEATTLATVKGKLEEALQATGKQLEEETAALEQKKADTAAAKEKLAAAEAAQKDAIEKLASAKEAHKEAKKSHSQAVASRQNIWVEMEAVCNAQDELAKAVSNFKEVIMPAFEAAKEKVAPPEPEPAPAEEEAAEEPPEKKQRTDEAATTEPAGDAPMSRENAD